ncbi:MAG: hypothetical protein KGD63_05480 [Candidatus Lokiarchaeota archaeon]|nr:hypothetical protein [Candidatus Lokiarchaeota archaeon]
MTSTPTSTRDGPYSTNTLASNKFLIIYFLNIWISFFLLLIESLVFWKLIEGYIIIFLLILPIEILFGYYTIVFSSFLISKLLIILINLIHKPKEGIFKRDKSDRDYYYWSLRAVVKKWPIWILTFIPSSLLNNLFLTLFGVKTSLSNSINHVNIDTEFIELGSKIHIGKGTFIKSSMIFGNYLIIKRIIIEDNVHVGPHSYISPGTIIKENTIINTLSVTKLNQLLNSNSVYSGYPVERINMNIEDTYRLNNIDQIFEEQITHKHNPVELSKPKKIPENKFIKKIPTYIGMFVIVYFVSYIIVFFGLYLYFTEIFFPNVLAYPSSSPLIITNISMIILVFTPVVILGFHVLNIIFMVLITKFLYYIICRINKPKEGIFHWSKKTIDYDFYFLRSFLLRYAKWKIQRSPYPWLIKSVFNFIGGCSIGKGTIIEDMYLSKEFIHIGENAYIGKILLTNQLWDTALTVKGVKIEDNVVINDGCCIAPGNIIEKGVSILPFSITSKYEHLKSNKIYYDAPIKEIKNKEELIKIMNINIENYNKQ